jgi:hypothetical protein
MSFFDDNASLDELKKDNKVIQDILWDLEPKQLSEPSYCINTEGKQEKRIIRGYVFYIDAMPDDKPGLFLMCHTSSSYAETVAHITEIPDELISEAIEENKSRVYFKMYPINEKIKTWLKKELGLQE